MSALEGGDQRKEHTSWPERSFDDMMATVHFVLSPRPHIVVDGEKCANCRTRECLNACPAKLFVLTAENRVLYSYEQCFECGTCYTICSQGAVSWNYPEGGHGVVFRYS